MTTGPCIAGVACDVATTVLLVGGVPVDWAVVVAIHGELRHADDEAANSNGTAASRTNAGRWFKGTLACSTRLTTFVLPHRFFIT